MRTGYAFMQVMVISMYKAELGTTLPQCINSRLPLALLAECQVRQEHCASPANASKAVFSSNS